MAPESATSDGQPADKLLETRPAAERSVTIGLVQCPSDMGDVARNLERLETACRSAAAAGSKIVVLPEMAVTGYLSQDLRSNWWLPGRPISREFSKERSLHPAAHAEPRDGPSTQRLARLAAELGIYITVPFLEVEESSAGQRFFNAVSLVAPDSPVAVAHYRKNCPWPHPEKSWATPGEGVEDAIYDTPYGRVGLAVCFDIHTILAKYAFADLWALLYPIAWVGDTELWFERELPRRLQEVNVPHFVFGANWATTAPEAWRGAGGSAAYAPGGELLAMASDGEGFRGKKDIVLVNVPTQDAAPKVGPLDMEAYGRWSEEQIGTRYWQDSDDPGIWTFAQELRAVAEGPPR